MTMREINKLWRAAERKAAGLPRRQREYVFAYAYTAESCLIGKRGAARCGKVADLSCFDHLAEYWIGQAERVAGGAA